MYLSDDILLNYIFPKLTPQTIVDKFWAVSVRLQSLAQRELINNESRKKVWEIDAALVKPEVNFSPDFSECVEYICKNPAHLTYLVKENTQRIKYEISRESPQELKIDLSSFISLKYFTISSTQQEDNVYLLLPPSTTHLHVYGKLSLSFDVKQVPPLKHLFVSDDLGSQKIIYNFASTLETLHVFSSGQCSPEYSRYDYNSRLLCSLPKLKTVIWETNKPFVWLDILNQSPCLETLLVQHKGCLLKNMELGQSKLKHFICCRGELPCNLPITLETIHHSWKKLPNTCFSLLPKIKSYSGPTNLLVLSSLPSQMQMLNTIFFPELFSILAGKSYEYLTVQNIHNFSWESNKRNFQVTKCFHVTLDCADLIANAKHIRNYFGRDLMQITTIKLTTTVFRRKKIWISAQSNNAWITDFDIQTMKAEYISYKKLHNIAVALDVIFDSFHHSALLGCLNM